MVSKKVLWIVGVGSRDHPLPRVLLHDKRLLGRAQPLPEGGLHAGNGPRLPKSGRWCLTKLVATCAVLVLDKKAVMEKMEGGEPDEKRFIELTRAPFDCDMRKVLFDEEGPDVKRAKLAAARLSSAAVRHLLK